MKLFLSLINEKITYYYCLFPDDYPGIPEDLIPELPIQFKDIVSISAQDGTGIDTLKNSVRRVIDEEAERQRLEMESHSVKNSSGW